MDDSNRWFNGCGSIIRRILLYSVYEEELDQPNVEQLKVLNNLERFHIPIQFLLPLGRTEIANFAEC